MRANARIDVVHAHGDGIPAQYDVHNACVMGWIGLLEHGKDARVSSMAGLRRHQPRGDFVDVGHDDLL